MKQQQWYQTDIRLNKVKEGFLIKRSRILKQWKERWMVLTKTHLYSFIQKQVYKKPTQSIPLKQVSTIKSYYKNQYARPQVIRIQSADTQFYLSTKNHQQKWSWMTAIEKMTDAVVCGNEETSQSVNMIRETLRMTTAIRNTVSLKNGEKSLNISENNKDVPKDLMKRLKLVVDSNAYQSIIIPTIKPQTTTKTQQQVQKHQQPTKVIQKIVQKIVYVPQIKQKIIYVPEIKQVIKTVYVQKNTTTTNNNNPYMGDKSLSINKDTILTDQNVFTTLLKFFQQVMHMKCQVIYCQQQIEPQTIDRVCCLLDILITLKIHSSCLIILYIVVYTTCFFQCFFTKIDEYKLNGYLQLIMVLYQNYDEYFYQNDLKLLIEILVRQMEMNRSNLNQFLIIGVLNAMAGKSWWSGVKHRREELIGVVRDVKAWTNDSQMRFAAQQLLQKM